MRYLLAALFLACAATARAADDDDEKLSLKKGDRIIFLGDSITQAGVKSTGYVTLIRQAIEKKRKDDKIEIIGAGVSGNRVPNLQKRLNADVLKKKPTLVVIYIGINDVWHSIRKAGTPKDRYEAGLKEIIGKIQKAGARVLLCTPSVIGEKSINALDKMLDEYSAISRKVAKATKVPVCDLRKAFVDYLKKNNSDDKYKGVLTTDGVHLNTRGNKLVAAQILKALGE